MSVLRNCLAGSFALLWCWATPAMAAEIKGTIARVSPETNGFVLTVNIADLTFQLAGEGAVFINGQRRALRDLRPGDEATVFFERQNQQLVAMLVQCTRYEPTTAHPETRQAASIATRLLEVLHCGPSVDR